jgi:site-specific DNA-methyltransferase (adenine-specific)
VKELLGSLELNRIYQIDCLEGMKLLQDKSIDAIICDLPYGTTKCSWDTVIPFDKLWEQYERIIKDDGAIILFGSEPFSSALRKSNLKLYKYDWYWKKSKANGFFNVKKMPLKSIETISVFYKKLPTYNPQGVIPFNKEVKNPKGKLDNGNHISGHNGGNIKQESYIREFTNYPNQLLEFSTVAKPIHNTQKPVELIEYLIKTYTNEGEIVLDNCMGSGTTAVAATLNNRRWIGFETESKYIELANKRLDNLEIHND